MAVIGGSVEEITIRGRIFPVAADSDVTINLGGIQNEVQSNGDGSARKIQTRIPWSVSGLAVQIDHVADAQGFLQEVARTPEYVPVTIKLASGAVYMGQGTIVEELESGSEASTAEITLSGPYELTLQ